MEDSQGQVKGAFVSSLKRTASAIKAERAQNIAEDAEISYRRRIDDMKLELKRLQRDRRNSLDLSPEDVNSLVMGRDFNGGEFVEKDIKAGIAIRNLKVKIELAEERFEYLFGEGKSETETTSSNAPAEVA